MAFIYFVGKISRHLGICLSTNALSGIVDDTEDSLGWERSTVSDALNDIDQPVEVSQPVIMHQPAEAVHLVTDSQSAEANHLVAVSESTDANHLVADSESTEANHLVAVSQSAEANHLVADSESTEANHLVAVSESTEANHLVAVSESTEANHLVADSESTEANHLVAVSQSAEANHLVAVSQASGVRAVYLLFQVSLKMILKHRVFSLELQRLVADRQSAQAIQLNEVLLSPVERELFLYAVSNLYVPSQIPEVLRRAEASEFFTLNLLIATKLKLKLRYLELYSELSPDLQWLVADSQSTERRLSPTLSKLAVFEICKLREPSQVPELLRHVEACEIFALYMLLAANLLLNLRYRILSPELQRLVADRQATEANLLDEIHQSPARSEIFMFAINHLPEPSQIPDVLRQVEAYEAFVPNQLFVANRVRQPESDTELSPKLLRQQEEWVHRLPKEVLESPPSTPVVNLTFQLPDTKSQSQEATATSPLELQDASADNPASPVAERNPKQKSSQVGGTAGARAAPPVAETNPDSSHTEQDSTQAEDLTGSKAEAGVTEPNFARCDQRRADGTVYKRPLLEMPLPLIPPVRRSSHFRSQFSYPRPLLPSPRCSLRQLWVPRPPSNASKTPASGLPYNGLPHGTSSSEVRSGEPLGEASSANVEPSTVASESINGQTASSADVGAQTSSTTGLTTESEGQPSMSALESEGQE